MRFHLANVDLLSWFTRRSYTRYMDVTYMIVGEIINTALLKYVLRILLSTELKIQPNTSDFKYKLQQ